MSNYYGQGYPLGNNPPPNAPYGGGGGPHGAPPSAPYDWAAHPQGGPYGGYGAPGQGGQYGPTAGGAPGGPYGGYGAPGQGGQYGPTAGGAPGGPYGGYGGQPQGGPYGYQPTAGNIPPGVNPKAYQLFQTIDTDRSGLINLKELQLASVNWRNTTDQTCVMIINMFDKTRSGQIDLFGFSTMWEFVQRWKALFQQYDRDRSGTINSTELHQALAQMGYNLGPHFSETLVRRFSVAGMRPGMQLKHFIQVCTKLQSMTQAFREKDTNMTGNIRINYEDFLSGAIVRLM